MIIDTSALIAVLTDEPSAPAITTALVSADRLAMSSATAVELAAVLSRFGRAELPTVVDRRLAAWGVEIAAFDEQQSRIARQAYRDFGRGSGHPARLNLGDCFSYALAIARDEPLLWVGDDFGHTDVRSGLPDTP